jgi:serine protease Do
MNGTLRKLAIPGLVLAGAAGGLTLADAARDPIPTLGAQSSPPESVAAAHGLSSAFRAASSAARGSVVHVRVTGAARGGGEAVPPELRGTPFEDMFRGRMQPQQPRAGAGSGFIISEDGYILTNNHVVQGAERVTVILADRREFDARVVGGDPNTDVAVVKVEARGLPVATFGDADQLEVGDWVLALGYPLDLGHTVTAGIVSAKGRNIGIFGRSGAQAPVEHFIQTDAAINPGNSGGPLVDLNGRVVGINSAIASPTGLYSGYGFAVPVNLARRVAEDLIRDGRVNRPMIGVEIRDANQADAEVFGLASADGAVVSGEPRGPAARAGLQMGDVIVAIDGRPVRGSGELMDQVMRRRPGDRVALDVIRYGQPRRTELRLDAFELPRGAAAAAEPREARPGARAAPARAEAPSRLGFRAEVLTPELARRLQVEAGGLVVTEVDPAGPAAGQLARGAVVRRVDGREVRTPDELRAAAERARPGAAVSLHVALPDGRETIINYRLRS